jgi:hypothetical protein
VLREVRGSLEQDRRLADAWFTAEEDERAWDEAAAEDAVELIDTGRDAFSDDRIDLVVEPGALVT